MALVEGLNRNTIITQLNFNQETYFETPEGIYLTPDFYYTYKVLAILYKDDTENIQTLDWEKKVYTNKVVQPVFIDEATINSDLAEQLKNFSEVMDDDQIIVQPTVLLEKLMQEFPTEQLVETYYLVDRQSSARYQAEVVPEEIVPLFTTLGIESRKREISSRGIQSISPDQRKDVESKKNLLPWQLLNNEIQKEQILEKNECVVEKVNSFKEVFSPSKMLVLLKENFLGKVAYKNSQNEFVDKEELPDLDDFFSMVKKIEQIGKENAYNQVPKEVKENVLKRITNKERNDLVEYFKKDFIFSPINTIQNQLYRVYEGARINRRSAYHSDKKYYFDKITWEQENSFVTPKKSKEASLKRFGYRSYYNREKMSRQHFVLKMILNEKEKTVESMKKDFILSEEVAWFK